jgi:hypothetical protein
MGSGTVSGIDSDLPTAPSMDRPAKDACNSPRTAKSAKIRTPPVKATAPAITRALPRAV